MDMDDVHLNMREEDGRKKWSREEKSYVGVGWRVVGRERLSRSYPRCLEAEAVMEGTLKMSVWVLRMYFLLWHFLRRLKKRNPQILRSFFHYFLAAKLQFFDCNTRLSLDHVRLWGLFSFNNLTECSKMKTDYFRKNPDLVYNTIYEDSVILDEKRFIIQNVYCNPIRLKSVHIRVNCLGTMRT